MDRKKRQKRRAGRSAGTDHGQALPRAIQLHRAGRFEEAESLYRQVLARQPEDPQALHLLGVLLRRVGKADQAVELIGKAIGLQPGRAVMFDDLGLSLRDAGNQADSAAAFGRAIELDPGNVSAMNNLGNILRDTGQVDEAVTVFSRAVGLKPDWPAGLTNLGGAMISAGQYEQGVEKIHQALLLQPGNVSALTNLSAGLLELEQFDEATEALREAISIDPDCSQARMSLALILLLQGRCDEQSWAQYQWRWKSPTFNTPWRGFPQPVWDFKSVPGRLLVWAEQGVGDEVMFASLLPALLKRGIDLVVECDMRLVPLLRRSFPQITVEARTPTPAAALLDKSITHQIPMGSLPSLNVNIEQSCSYLQCDLEKSAQLRTRYLGKDSERLVGISWRSGNSQEGHKRTIPLDQWGPILSQPGLGFVSLQYGDPAADIAAASQETGAEIIHDRSVEPLHDLEAFAAQVAAMDSIISIDNSTVHFAGALGKRVWTLLPTVPDWRWGLKATTTRWYSTMQLFRQQRRGCWGGVIESVAEKLAGF